MSFRDRSASAADVAAVDARASSSLTKSADARRTSDGKGRTKEDKKEEKKRLGTMRSKSGLLKSFSKSGKIKDEDDGQGANDGNKQNPQRQLSSNFASPMGDVDAWPNVTPEETGKVFGRDLVELSLATFGTKECQKLLRDVMKTDQERPSDFDPIKSLPIPRVVTVCIAYLAQHLKEEGLFRISGGNSEVQKIKRFFEAHVSSVTLARFEEFCRIEQISVSGVAGVLKQFFRLLPEPVLPSRFYTTVLKILENDSTSKEEKVGRVRTLVKGMPPLSRCALMHLCQFLKLVSQFDEDNKMTIDNLAVVWGPNLIRPLEADESQSRGSTGSGADISSLFHMDKVKSAATVLIEHADHLWLDSKNDVMRRQIKSDLADQFVQSTKPAELDPSLAAQFAAKLAAATAALGSTLKQTSFGPDVPGMITIRASGWIAVIQGMTTLQRYCRLETSLAGVYLALFEKEPSENGTFAQPINYIPLGVANGTTCSALSGAESRIFGQPNLVKISQHFRGNETQNCFVFSCGSETDRELWAQIINTHINPRIVANIASPQTSSTLQTADLMSLSAPGLWVVTRTEVSKYCQIFSELVAESKSHIIPMGQAAEKLGIAAARLGVDVLPRVLSDIVRSCSLESTIPECAEPDTGFIGEAEFCAACFLMQKHQRNVPERLPAVTWASILPELLRTTSLSELDEQRRARVSAGPRYDTNAQVASFVPTQQPSDQRLETALARLEKLVMQSERRKSSLKRTKKANSGNEN